MPKVSKLTDLKVDRFMLNSKFEGYKLSLDRFPVHSVKLPQNVHQCHASESQWSLLHVNIFANHNHLIFDTMNNGRPTFYCFLTDGSVCKLTLTNDQSNFELVTVLHIRFPEDFANRGDKYNATLSLPSADFAFLSNGCGSLWLCDKKFPNWKVLSEIDDVCNGAAFVIVDSCTKEDGKSLECLLLLIEDGSTSETKSGHFANLLWVTFGYENNSTWNICRKRQLQTDGVLEYFALSREISAVCIVSSKAVRFVSDSEKPVVSHVVETDEDITKRNYTWTQTTEEVRLLFFIEENVSSWDVKWVINRGRISLSLNRGDTSLALICGELFSLVETQSSSWSVNNNKLEVILRKADYGKIWTEVVIGDCCGEYVEEPNLIHSSCGEQLEPFNSETLEKPTDVFETSYSAEQLEECDSASEKELSLTWWDGETHQIIFEADLRGRQWLFSVSLNAYGLPHICLRHDVDGILWQIPNNPTSVIHPCGSHYATFDAFGYVHAGKQSRKFITCSLDCSYAVICDCNKHAYVYWSKKEIDTCLRNRKTGKAVSHIAKQQLISLNGSQDLLGVVALPNILLLVTEFECHIAHVGVLQTSSNIE